MIWLSTSWIMTLQLTLVGLVLAGGSALVHAETTFVANYNNTQTGPTPDYMLAGSSLSQTVYSTASDETVDLPANSTPGKTTISGYMIAPINPTSVVPDSAALDIHGGRDGVRYMGLAAGTISRSRGTAEGFFRTPYSLSTNAQPIALFGGWVSFTDGKRWYWSLQSGGPENNRLNLYFGDNSTGGGLVTVTTDSFGANDWLPDVWHHVAVTWNTTVGVFQLFIDGKLMGCVTNGSLPVTSAVENINGNRVFIGMTSSGTGSLNNGEGNNLEGFVDNIRLDNIDKYDSTGFNIGDQVFTPPTSEHWRAIKPFSMDTTSWTTYAGSDPVATKFNHRTCGYQFTCDMSTIADGNRGNWETAYDSAFDLSSPNNNGEFTYIGGWAKVTNADAIDHLSFYFSDGTWSNYYAGGVYQLHEGWNYFRLLKVNMDPPYASGSPSWSSIRKVRFSMWKSAGSTKTATVELYDVEVSAQPRNYPPFEAPEYETPLPSRLLRTDPNTGLLLETRAILDEQDKYLTDGVATTISNLSGAHLNTFIPCVWHGWGAIYDTSATTGTGTGTTLDSRYASYFAATDPLEALITQAHNNNIEVQGWFTVGARQVAGWHPANVAPQVGTPAGMFEVHDANFRDWIVNEIVEFAKHYDVDGINLDFIRTGGVSTSSSAIAEYDAIFGLGAYSADQIANYPNITAAALARLRTWQANAVSDIVQRVSQGVKNIKPKVVITTSGAPEKTGDYSDQGRNEWLWVQNDWVDVAYAMDYGPVPTSHWKLLNARATSPFPGRFAEMPGNYEYPLGGSIQSRDAVLLNRQLDYYLRKSPESGVALYWYSSLNDAQKWAMSSGALHDVALAFNTLSDRFEKMTVDTDLTADLRWTSLSGQAYSSATISSKVVPPGLTHSAVFQHQSGTTQVYWLNLPRDRSMTSVSFDVYVDNHPGGSVNLEVRPSTGTAGLRDVGLKIGQHTPSTWRLTLVPASGTNITYPIDVAVNTWHRVKFRNDVVNRTYTIVLDGTVLADNVAYIAGFNLGSIANFQWQNTGTNADLYIANLVIQDP